MKLSQEKKDKISEQIIGLLFHSFPKQLYTSEIAKELARDEEFIKSLLFELKKKAIIISIKKNEKGTDFIRRIRWQLSSEAYKIYKEKAQ